MDTPVRTWRRALTASTAIVVAAVLGTTGLAWGSGDIRRAGVVSQQEAPANRGDAFVSVEPVRILDTRPPENGPIGVPTAGPLMGGQEIDLPLTTSAPNARSIPLPDDATAVLVNVTIDGDATQRSFLTVWPVGTPRPFASADNAGARSGDAEPHPRQARPDRRHLDLRPGGGHQPGHRPRRVHRAAARRPAHPADPLAEGLLFGEGPPTDAVGSTGSISTSPTSGSTGPRPMPAGPAPRRCRRGHRPSRCPRASTTRTSPWRADRTTARSTTARR